MTDQFRKRLESDCCIYCGERATQDEHWPPQCCGDEGYILSACGECNSLAGTDFPYEFIKRAALVKERLNNRYRRELTMADWSCEELAAMERSTWLPTLEGLRLKLIVQERLSWDALGYIAMIDRDDIFVPVATGEATIVAEIDMPLWD